MADIYEKIEQKRELQGVEAILGGTPYTFEQIEKEFLGRENEDL